MDYKYIVFKYFEFYHHLYYINGDNLKEAEIWLAALTSNNFIELNDMLSHILSDTDKEKIVGEAIIVTKSRP